VPATLVHHLGLRELVDEHLDLGPAVGRANVGDKLLTLVMSALAGGDCIDDADALRAGGTERVLGFSVKAPSTLGTFLRSFRWGHVRQLDRVSRELLRRAWAAGAGPGDGPFTFDLDSTLCETYGLKKEGGSAVTHTGARGYHPLLAVAAGSGDVLMARLRGGTATSGRSAGHFLTETVSRIRYAGATGQLTMRADSGFYTHAVVAAARTHEVRFSITVRQHKGLRRLIETIPEQDWTPIPYWIGGGADVAETIYTPFADHEDAVPVRLIVRRVKPTPGSQLALLTLYDYHAFIPRLHHRPRRGHAGARVRPSRSRRDRERHPGPEGRSGPETLPVGPVRGQRRLAGGAGGGPRRGALERADRPGSRDHHHQDPAAAAVRPPRSAHSLGPTGDAPSTPALALGGGLPPGTRETPGHPAHGLTAALAAPDPALRHAHHARRVPSKTSRAVSPPR